MLLSNQVDLIFRGVIRSQKMIRVILYDASRTIKPLSVGGLLYITATTLASPDPSK